MKIIFLCFCIIVVAVHSEVVTTTATNSANGPTSRRVDHYLPNRYTPGNVGLCLSGGGSIALSNVMGYLRGLRYLGLDKYVKAISTSSGGSWGTAPYTYLPSIITDQEFLGEMVVNPGELTLTSLFNSNPAAVLDTMGPRQLGMIPTQSGFSFIGLATQALALYVQGVPDYRLWGHLIGEYILAPFGLSEFDSTTNCPKYGFCGDDAQCQAIEKANPSMKGRLFQPRAGRPFHIMNTAMFVRPNWQSSSSSFAYLAPVQSTPWFTGIMSTPDATFNSNGNDIPVGGGGVQSFGFNSIVNSVNGNDIDVSPKDNCPFAISDITGASSAAFAETVKNNLYNLPHINPKFSYWPVTGVQAGMGTMMEFSDAGTIENNGIASMLSYEDIDNLISVAYATVPISQDSNGVIVLDGSYPSLFGMQEYSSSNGGYLPIPAPPASMPNDLSTEFRFNQVFESSEWQNFLDGMWAATTNNGQSPAGTAPAVFLMQNLKVLENKWFGVKGGRTVNVLFVYVNAASDWNNQLAMDVQVYINTFLPSFPQLGFLDISQPARHVNLLAHFASWVVNTKSTLFQAMFDPSGPGAFLAANNANNASDDRWKIGVAAGAGGLLVVAVAAAVALVIKSRRRRNVEMVEMTVP